MSYLLTEEMVREAVDLVRPAIDHIRTTFAKRSHGHLIVVDPNSGSEPENLYEESWGDPATEWEHSYDLIAQGKADLCFYTGRNSRTVVTEEPYLLGEGHTQWVGAIVSGPSRRLVVSYSGAEDYVDEMICYLVAAAIQMVSRRAFANLPAELDFPWDEEDEEPNYR